MPNVFRGRQSTNAVPVHLTKEEAAMGAEEALRAIDVRFRAERTKADLAYAARVKTIATREDSAYAELQVMIAARAAEAVRLAQPNVRRRQPLAVTHDRQSQSDAWYVPPTCTSEILETRIDEICGCKGCHDCDCVSVFNRATRELWGEHNGLPRATPESRRKEDVDV